MLIFWSIIKMKMLSSQEFNNHYIKELKFLLIKELKFQLNSHISSNIESRKWINIHDTASDPLIKKVTCVYISISIIQTAIFFYHNPAFINNSLYILNLFLNS